jgi:hypothetical protein
MTGDKLAGSTERHGLGEILFIDIGQDSLTCEVQHVDKISIHSPATIVGILGHHRIFDSTVAKDTVHFTAWLQGINGLVSTTVDEQVILVNTTIPVLDVCGILAYINRLEKFR